MGAGSGGGGLTFPALWQAPKKTSKIGGNRTRVLPAPPSLSPPIPTPPHPPASTHSLVDAADLAAVAALTAGADREAGERRGGLDIG